MTVSEIDARMSGAELLEWRAYFALDPFGEDVDDMRAAMVAHAAVAPHVKECPPPDAFLLRKNRGAPMGPPPEDRDPLLAMRDWLRRSS